MGGDQVYWIDWLHQTWDHLAYFRIAAASVLIAAAAQLSSLTRRRFALQASSSPNRPIET